MTDEARLIVLGGLPGTGKTTIARELARQLRAVHLRIDSIEQAVLDARLVDGPVNDAGYRVACALARDNLLLGLTVIADSVNPLEVTRAAWRAVAERAGVAALGVEVVCSDSAEHQRRIETRTVDVPGLRAPAWQDVLAREYEPWSDAQLVLDTAVRSVDECVERIREAISGT